MKNFLKLLGTKPKLIVTVDNQITEYEIHHALSFDETSTVSVDGIEILPHYRHLARDGKLVIDEPFYCWYHRVTGKGWLLMPQ